MLRQKRYRGRGWWDRNCIAVRSVFPSVRYPHRQHYRHRVVLAWCQHRLGVQVVLAAVPAATVPLSHPWIQRIKQLFRVVSSSHLTIVWAHLPSSPVTTIQIIDYRNCHRPVVLSRLDQPVQVSFAPRISQANSSDSFSSPYGAFVECFDHFQIPISCYNIML